MRVPIAEAERQLSELVGRVEDGEEVVLTRGGVEVARLVSASSKVVPFRSASPPVQSETPSTSWAELSPDERLARLEKIRLRAEERRARGELSEISGAEAQEELYDEFGLPK
jgi:prevent-host-death family protein